MVYTCLHHVNKTSARFVAVLNINVCLCSIRLKFVSYRPLNSVALRWFSSVLVHTSEATLNLGDLVITDDYLHLEQRYRCWVTSVMSLNK